MTNLTDSDRDGLSDWYETITDRGAKTLRRHRPPQPGFGQ